MGIKVPMDSQKDPELISNLQSKLVNCLNTHCRRSGKDRRSWKPMPTPPFEDQYDVWVTTDRRKLPDRRLKGIQVTWLDQQ